MHTRTLSQKPSVPVQDHESLNQERKERNRNFPWSSGLDRLVSEQSTVPDGDYRKTRVDSPSNPTQGSPYTVVGLRTRRCPLHTPNLDSPHERKVIYKNSETGPRDGYDRKRHGETGVFRYSVVRRPNRIPLLKRDTSAGRSLTKTRDYQESCYDPLQRLSGSNGVGPDDLGTRKGGRKDRSC